MKNNAKMLIVRGILLILAFALWTVLVKTLDLQTAGESGTIVGFGSFNSRFFAITGYHPALYNITDWLGLVPLCICLCFAFLGVIQLIKRRSLLKVDFDIILLGIYYLIILFAYFLFEAIAVNYRPVLIDGRLESSYPSSTTLLVLGVMPTLIFHLRRRCPTHIFTTLARLSAMAFSFFMVMGRLISGVHWFTDIVAAMLLCGGLFSLYKAAVLLIDGRFENGIS